MPILISLICCLSASPARAELSGTTTATLEERSGEGAESPVKPILDYRSDVVRGLSGGNDTASSSLVGSLNLGAEVGFGSLSAHLEGLAVYGKSPSDRVGDFQGVDNISAPHAIRVYQAWLQQSVLGDRVAVLAGLHDLTADFYQAPTAQQFMNSSFGIGPELSRSGKAGPSIWSSTAPGGRVRVQATEAVQLSAAVYNGVPGDPDHPERVKIALRDDDGVMGISELAVAPKIHGLSGKYALGAWGYDRELDDLSETDDDGAPVKARSFGMYLLLDQKLYAPRAGDAVGLSGFLRLGWGNSDTSAAAYSAQAGLVYTGLIPRREQDQLGIGAAVARAGSHYRAALLARGSDSTMHEAAFELMYRARLASWLYAQPDLQWVASPGMSSATADALVGSARLELSL